MKMKFIRQRAKEVREWMTTVLEERGHDATFIQGYINSFEDDDELYEFARDYLDMAHVSGVVAELRLASSYINHLENCLKYQKYRNDNCSVKKAQPGNGPHTPGQHRPSRQGKELG